MYTRALPILLLLAGVRSQYISCPLLGADFPPPTNLASDSFIAAAAQNLTAQLSALTNSSTSFSVQFFSAADPSPLFDYHHTAPSVAQSSAGTQVITADSIYRVGSISKLYTVFLFLSEVGDGYFHRPVTEFVWELADADMMRVEGDGRTRWGDITLGALASQMAGIARDDGQADLLAYNAPWTELGLPELTAEELPSCGFNNSVPACTRAPFLKDLINHPPVFAPFTTPIYSNAAFGVLAFALENITNKSFPDMMASMYTKLNLTKTSYTTPNSTDGGVIPWNTTYAGWDIDEAAGDPAGTIFASSTDHSNFGRAILNNVLISSAATRRWMKPSSFSGLMTSSVGAPWEIFRIASSTSPIITDYYTKGGDIGVYSSIIALLPAYNTGFSIFTADGAAANTVATISDMVASTFGVALEAAAKSQAGGRFEGTYAATDGSNSSVVISMSDTFGLAVSSWISDGNDMSTNIELTQGITDPSSLPFLLAKLVPSGYESFDNATGITGMPFVAVLGFSGEKPTNVFDLNCATWTTVDALVYGGEPVDLMVFGVNGTGEVVSVEVPALRVTLAKVNGTSS